MTVEEAAKEFGQLHLGSRWLHAVGVGKTRAGFPRLVVYTKSKQVPQKIALLNEYGGYELTWHYIGKVTIGGKS